MLNKNKKSENYSKQELKEFEIERERKNLDFVQFSRKAMHHHRELISKNPLAAYILDFFIEHMNRSNAIVCSIKVIEEVTGKSRSTVNRALKVLKSDNWIQTIRIGNANAYVINSAAFWSSAATNKAFSMFHSTVIASQSEQQAMFNELAKIKTKSVPVLSLNERAILDNEELPPPDQKDLDLN